MLSVKESEQLFGSWERSASRLSGCRDADDLTNLLASDPTSPLALLWRGELRLKAGDAENACADFVTYLDVGASSSRFLELLTELLSLRPDLASRFEPYREPRNKLSIPLIVKDEADNLPRFLASVADLAYELIVVDTGSTDETVAIARDYGARVERFEWVNDFSAARNYALSLCKGDWCAWVDADEEWTDEARDIVTRRLNDPDCQAIQVDLWDAQDDGRYDRYGLMRVWRHHPACVFRYPVEEMNDWSITALSVRYGRKIAIEPDAVIRHYGHGESETARKGKHERNAALSERRLRENGLTDKRALEMWVGGLRGQGRTDEATALSTCFGLAGGVGLAVPSPTASAESPAAVAFVSSESAVFSVEKCPTREHFPLLLNELGLTGEWVEVGVNAGEYSEHLLRYGQCERLFSVDCWEQQADYPNVCNTPQETQNHFYELAVARLAVFGERSVVVKAYSLDAAETFADGSLDFVFLDARHEYLPFLEDLEAWSPKVRQGGVLAGHDYSWDGEFWHGSYGVQRAIAEFAERQGWTVRVTHADTPSSWFVVV